MQADAIVESGKADMDGASLSDEYAHLLHRGSGDSMCTPRITRDLTDDRRTRAGCCSIRLTPTATAVAAHSDPKTILAKIRPEPSPRAVAAAQGLCVNAS